jgi:hypothetical protein
LVLVEAHSGRCTRAPRLLSAAHRAPEKLGVGNGGLALQREQRLGALGRCGRHGAQLLVDGRVDAAHEEAGHGANAVDGQAGGGAGFQSGQVGFDDARMRIDRKEQRDIHVDAVGNELPNGLGAFRRARHLDHEVGAIDDRPKPVRLGDRGGRITRQIG